MSNAQNTSEASATQAEHSKVFEMLAHAINEHITSPMDEAAVEKIVDAKVAEARLPRPIEIRQQGKDAVVIEDTVHAKFEEVLDLITNEGHVNVMLVGPAGTGKTTLAKSISKALGLQFGFLSLSAGVTETHLMGRFLPQADGSWQYTPSRFVEIYEKGGVFLLDEIDAADPNVMVAINAALANGVLANPNGMIHERHSDCIIIAAGNTWGRGGDTQYVGRNQLDASSLDRFTLATVFVDYDADLEGRLTAGVECAGELMQWVADLRQSIKTNRLRRLASTRLVVNSVKAIKAGKSLAQIKSRYFQDWATDEKSKVGYHA